MKKKKRNKNTFRSGPLIFHVNRKNQTSVSAVKHYALRGNTYEVDIPDSVTEIEKNAFSGYRNLRRVRIPNSVTTIGDNAFSDCGHLECIDIPSSVILIGEDAFFRCTSLKMINVSSENEYYESINGVLFSKKEKKLICFPQSCGFSEFTVPDGTLSIGKRAFFSSPFSRGSSLKSIKIPNTVIMIEEEAFAHCGLHEIAIPKGVKMIAPRTFFDCYNIKKVTLPADLQTISDYGFKFCKSLTTINLPDTIENIGEGAFSCCKQLDNITLPAGLQSISARIFEYCTNLTAVTLPDTIKRIGEYAFSCCSQLSSIKLPKGLESIYTGSFQNCTNLETINLPDTLKTIGAEAFWGCDRLQATLPKSVRDIGNYAFYPCERLTFDVTGDDESSYTDSVFRMTYMERWQNEMNSVILHCPDFDYKNNLLLPIDEEFPVNAYAKCVKWGEVKPEVGSTITISVNYPFYCMGGGVFSVTYGKDEFVTGRLIRILEMEESTAVIEAEIIAKGNVLSFVRRLSEEERTVLENTFKYDYPFYHSSELPFVRWISDNMFRFYLDLGGGDVVVEHLVYTDEDGVDHLVGKFYQDFEACNMSFGDRVIGLHKYCPVSVSGDEKAEALPEHITALAKNHTFHEKPAENSEWNDYYDAKGNEVYTHRMPPWKVDGKKKR